jgi:hypothetical protein
MYIHELQNQNETTYPLIILINYIKYYYYIDNLYTEYMIYSKLLCYYKIHSEIKYTQFS